jgi:hypothetical protein
MPRKVDCLVQNAQHFEDARFVTSNAEDDEVAAFSTSACDMLVLVLLG